MSLGGSPPLRRAQRRLLRAGRSGAFFKKMHPRTELPLRSFFKKNVHPRQAAAQRLFFKK